MYYSAQNLPKNRSMSASTVIPVLPYPDVRQAVEWLIRVFGFAERLQIGDHRSQMLVGDGAMVVAEYIDSNRRPQPGEDHVSHEMMVRVENVQAHFEHARTCGAEILQPPVEHFYGERQYVVRDVGGHRWTFSETIADADPKDWGDEHVVLKVGG